MRERPGHANQNAGRRGRRQAKKHLKGPVDPLAAQNVPTPLQWHHAYVRSSSGSDALSLLVMCALTFAHVHLLICMWILQAVAQARDVSNKPS